MTPDNVLSVETHDQVWALLPWYVNQTLAGDELQLVEMHLKVCIPCRSELSEQQTLCQAVQESTVEALPEKVQFARLMQRIQSGGL